MMMFWIFFIVDLFTIGIFYAVYGGKREYSEGMLMGVHMPRSAAESEEVSGIMRQYRKRRSRKHWEMERFPRKLKRKKVSFRTLRVWRAKCRIPGR